MDIVERLRSPEVFITDGPMISPVAQEAANEIERLRNNQSILITSFRINMMRLRPDYTHEEFDRDIAYILTEKSDA